MFCLIGTNLSSIDDVLRCDVMTVCNAAPFQRFRHGGFRAVHIPQLTHSCSKRLAGQRRQHLRRQFRRQNDLVSGRGLDAAHSLQNATLVVVSRGFLERRVGAVIVAEVQPQLLGPFRVSSACGGVAVSAHLPSAVVPYHCCMYMMVPVPMPMLLLVLGFVPPGAM